MSSKKSRARLFQTGKDKPRLTEEQKQAGLRVKHLSWIYFDKYPHGLPHNKIGVNYSKYMCRTMAYLPDDRRSQWLDRHAPWLDRNTREYILRLGPYWYDARALGGYLDFDDVDRERLQASSVEARDVSYEERQEINREKDRKRQKARRRSRGAKPREQSYSQTKPWLADDISRSTWERRRRKASDANSSAPSLIYKYKRRICVKPGTHCLNRPSRTSG
jgi:hypothetical protein